MTSMKKKVLVLTSTFPRWRGDTVPPFVYELSKRLATNFEVHVLAPYSEGSQIEETLDGLYVRRFKYWFGRSDYLGGAAILPALKRDRKLWLLVPFFLLSQFMNLVRTVEREEIDVIHAHWIVPQGLLAVLYKKIFNTHIRIVITSHGADVFGLKWFNPLKRSILNNCSAVTAVSNAIVGELKKLRLKDWIPIELMPMGVDLSHFSPESSDETLRKEFDIRGPFLLFVGRLTEKKGVDYLLNAMPAVVTEHPDAKLVIVGQGEEESHLKEQARRMGLLERNVVFAGGVTNSLLPRYYASADLFIGPSVTSRSGDREGFGLVFVEALGCSCPVIASNLPSISDIVLHGKTGFVVEQKNSAAIAEAVNSLLEDSSLLNSLRREGRKHVVDLFDWNRISGNYSLLLKSLSDCISKE